MTKNLQEQFKWIPAHSNLLYSALRASGSSLKRRKFAISHSCSIYWIWKGWDVHLYSDMMLMWPLLARIPIVGERYRVENPSWHFHPQGAFTQLSPITERDALTPDPITFHCRGRLFTSCPPRGSRSRSHINYTSRAHKWHKTFW